MMWLYVKQHKRCLDFTLFMGFMFTISLSKSLSLERSQKLILPSEDIETTSVVSLRYLTSLNLGILVLKMLSLVLSKDSMPLT